MADEKFPAFTSTSPFYFPISFLLRVVPRCYPVAAVVFYLCFTATLVGSTSLPGANRDAATIIEAPQNAIVEMNKKASFSCRADGNPMPTIKWLRNGKEVSEFRYVTKSLQDGRSTLRVEPVRSRDNDSLITCTADNGLGAVISPPAKLVALMTSDLPSGLPRILEHPRLKAVEKGRTARMVCRYVGEPPIDVIWLRDLIPIDMTDRRYSIATIGSPGALLIANSSELDEGKYECIVRNEYGTAHSKSAHLYVKVRRVPPHFSIPPNLVYDVKPGGSVNLSCTAVGYPMPHVYWKVGYTDLESPEAAPIGRNVLLVSDVSESKNYTCVAVSALGNIEFQTQVVVKALPGSPTKLRVLDQTAHSVSLAWNAPSEANELKHYIVHYRPKSADGNDYLESEPVNLPRISLAGLEPFTLYEFRVIAVNNVGRSQPSYPVETTTNETRPDSPPQNLKARSLTNTAIVVTWEAPLKANGEVTEYVIIYTTNPKEPVVSWKKKVVKEGRLTNIDQLIPLSLYSVRVQAVNKMGPGPFSEPVLVLAKQNAPGQPTNVRAIATGSSEVLVEWEEPQFASSSVSEYIVKYNSTEAGESAEKPTGTRKPELRFTSLRSDTTYSFQVIAKGPKGDHSAPSRMVTETTKPSVPTARPVQVSAKALSRNEIRVLWEEPPRDSNKGPVQSYRIRWKPVIADEDETESGVSEAVVGADKPRSFTIQRLRTWTSYEVTVAAGNAKGFGPKSEPVTVQTSEDVLPSPVVEEKLPGAPESLRLSPLNATAVRVRWSPPQEPNGELFAYYVHIDELADGELLKSHSKTVRVEKDTLEVTVPGLKPNTEYSFRVNAVNRRGDGEFTQAKRYFVPGEVPTEPSNLRVTAEERQSVIVARLTWDPPAEAYGSVIQRYKIQWGSPEDINVLREEEVKKAPYIVAGLEHGRNYIFRVSAENSEGYGGYAEKSLQTPDSVPTGAPVNVRYEYLSDRLLEFTWEPPEQSKRNGNITTYESELKTVHPPEVKAQASAEPKWKVTVGAGTVHEFRVRAATVKGYGPWSSWFRVEHRGKVRMADSIDEENMGKIDGGCRYFKKFES